MLCPLNKLSQTNYPSGAKYAGEQDILWLEKQEGSLNFKFGVIFARPGQIMDDELFSNEVASAQFNHFLSLLGSGTGAQLW